LDLTVEEMKKEHMGLLGAIKNGHWVEFGVRNNSWNDFMMLALGRINQEQRPNGYYMGEEGFDRAKEELQLYANEREETGESINLTDFRKDHGGLIHAINNDYWVKFEVDSWDDFMIAALGWKNEIKYKTEDLKIEVERVLDDLIKKDEKIEMQKVIDLVYFTKRYVYQHKLSYLVNDAIERQLTECRYNVDHEGEHPHMCSKCEYENTNPTKMRRHFRTHSGEKPYSCNECGEAFSAKGTLKAHVRTHTGEKPYQCNYCEERFTTSSDRGRHERRHTGERPYPCDQCDYAATQNYNLKRHYRIHTGEKPFKCEPCGYVTNNKGHLTRHKKTNKHQKYINEG